MKDFSPLEKNIKIKFKNPDLLLQAFVHRSYLNEHPNFKVGHNERLEFLGDAVLELIVTSFLYNNYQSPEGDLTNWRSALVRTEMISEIAKELNFEDYILLSRGETKSSGRSRQVILANAFEALIGAIYLDQGYDATDKFIAKFLLPRLPQILEEESYIDSKSRFQELAQEREGITPGYKVIEEFGPDHAKEFLIGAYLEDRLLGKGSGPSKQLAQQSAAQEALKQYSHVQHGKAKS